MAARSSWRRPWGGASAAERAAPMATGTTWTTCGAASTSSSTSRQAKQARHLSFTDCFLLLKAVRRPKGCRDGLDSIWRGIDEVVDLVRRRGRQGLVLCNGYWTTQATSAARSTRWLSSPAARQASSVLLLRLSWSFPAGGATTEDEPRAHHITLKLSAGSSRKPQIMAGNIRSFLVACAMLLSIDAVIANRPYLSSLNLKFR